MVRATDLYGTGGSVPDVSAEGGGGTPFSVRSDANDFGGQTAKAVESAGNQIFDMGNHYVQMATEAKANDTLANTWAPKAAQLRADYDSLDGQDKIAGYDTYISGLKKAQTELVEGAKSPLEKQILGNYVTRHVLSEVDGAKRELVQSQKQFSADAVANRIMADSGYAVANYNNPQIVDSTLASNKALITTQVADEHIADGGPDPSTPEGQAIIDEKYRSATGALATDMITRAVNTGDVNTAYQLRSKFDSVMPGFQQLHVDNLLHAQSMQQVGLYGVAALQAGKPLPEVTGSPASQVQAVVANAAQSKNHDINDALTVLRIETGYGQNLGKIGNIGQTIRTKAGATLQEQAADLVAEKSKANAQATLALGRDATNAEGYVVYQQGEAGGSALLKSAASNSMDKAVDVLSKFYKSPQVALKAVIGNGGNATMTAGDFVNFLTKKYDDNAKRAAVEAPKEYAQADTGTESDATILGKEPTKSIGDAIIAPHTTSGDTVQPAATPRQALLNFDDKYPGMLQRANAIPNIETRQRVIKSLEAQRATYTGASNAYTQKLVNDATTLMTKKDFNVDRDVTPEMQAALSTDHPQTLLAMQARSDRIAEHGTGENSKDVKENGDKFFDLTSRMNLPAGDPNRINDESQLLPYVNSGLTLKGWQQAKKLLGQDDVRKKFMTNGMSQITSFASNKGDTEGQRQAYAWYNFANQQIDDKLAEGKKLSDLIDPKSKDYVGKSINLFREYILDHPNDMQGSPDLAQRNPNQAQQVMDADPRVAKAKAAGYTDEEIQAYLSKKK